MIPKCPVETTDGVADVVRLSPERYELVKDQDAYFTAPELCVAVMSDSNSEREMQTKGRQYPETGAVEVWGCDPDGRIRFFDRRGERSSSALLPDFPTKVPAH